MVDYPAISGITDPSNVRVMLLQGKQQVNAPLTGLGLQPLDADLTSWAAIVRGAGFDAFAASIIGTSGYLVDSVTATYVANANLTTIIPSDDTPPLITEGDQILTASISPKTATNKLRCRFTGFGTRAEVGGLVAALFQGSTCIDALNLSITAAGNNLSLVLEAEFTPASISSVAISVRVGPNSAGTVRFNGGVAGRFFGGAANATLVVEEIKA